MSRFDCSTTEIAGLVVLERRLIGDSRGYFERIFCTKDLDDLVGDRRIEQVNHTLTRRAGTIRGLHFQYPPYSEMKLVTCLRGCVYDVAVDMRRDSPTFGSWHSEMLAADNHRMLVIPEGFAHGFQTLTDDCELLYLHTAGYQADAEGGIDAFDPFLAIEWPLAPVERSDRDQRHPPLKPDFNGIPV
ncbi:MAG TPA: dTDP-4-dehydrorhamnose 3,5-epimerase [Azoarcus taiwanensis]|nr:dTDP-4-dehydrorhamnose 3,5-epimerase [Azoarcus taiwanensis]